MTPDETQLLTALIDRVRQTQLLHTDPDAERMIRELTVARPEAAYILAQTVVMQDFALRQARAKLDDLQRQLDDARTQVAQQQAAPRSGGFFSGLFGGTPAPSPSVPPTAGPWGGRPAAASYAQQTYAPPPPPPNYGAATGYAGGAQAPSFLQGAAQTAMGVAGGALLFEGIESMFGGHHGFGGMGYGGGFGGGGFGDSVWGGGMPQETVNETVNNYYEGTPPTDSGYAGTDFTPSDQGNFTDTGFDTGGDFGSDLGGGFGNDDDSSYI